MISRVQFDAYNQATENIANQAAAFVEQQINAWIAANPNASVSEIRNAAKEIMNAAIPIYNDSIAELGSQLWDETAREAGAEIDRAITTHTFSERDVKKVCHYQARHLIDGDYSAFAARCGEFASNNAMKALNEAMLANAKRDKKGARFARVPTGKETCAFCLMLATRGAVYWSRKSAGEFNHYHRNCDCKVVPSYEGQYGEYVEGYSAIEVNNRLVEIADAFDIEDMWHNLNQLNRVLSLHSPEYLANGQMPKVDYSLNPREKYGTLIKPNDYTAENITNKGNEWRDLVVHDVLSKKGFAVTAQPQSELDIKIGEEWWEIKSPQERQDSQSGNLRYIEDNLRKAARQFDKRGLDNARVVFNSYYRQDDESAVISELLNRGKEHGIKEIMYISPDGEVVILTP